MNRDVRRVRLFLTSLVLVAAVAGSACAQQARRVATPAGDSGEALLRVREFTAIGRQSLVRTPEYRTTAGAGTGRLKEWAQITLRYDTGPKWIDELVFQHYVLTRLEEPGSKPTFSFFKNTVRYVDIERGSDHLSTVFLHPNAIERYGLPVAAAVEISFDGKVVATESQEDRSLKLSPKWWQDPKVVQSENVVTRDGYLLSRSDSPFALVNIDDHEVSR